MCVFVWLCACVSSNQSILMPNGSLQTSPTPPHHTTHGPHEWIHPLKKRRSQWLGPPAVIVVGMSTHTQPAIHRQTDETRSLPPRSTSASEPEGPSAEERLAAHKKRECEYERDLIKLQQEGQTDRETHTRFDAYVCVCSEEMLHPSAATHAQRRGTHTCLSVCLCLSSEAARQRPARAPAI